MNQKHTAKNLVHSIVAGLAAMWIAGAAAQSTSTTTVTASATAVGTGEGVTLTAAVAGPVSYDVRFKAGAALGLSGRAYVRFELINATFGSSVSLAGFSNITESTATSTPIAILGGGEGDSYFLFEITAPTGRGILATDTLSLLIGQVNVTGSNPSVKYSLHNTVSSGSGATPLNSALLATSSPELLSTFLVSNTITGTVQFTDNGVPITGCTAVVLASNAATCSTSFSTIGLHSISATYSGDAAFLTSSGTLAGGINVGLPVSPSVLVAPQVGVAYSATLSASGGTAPYTFSLTSNTTLPPGLTLSSAGVISGTPTTAGTYAVSVSAQDASLMSGSRNYSMVVAKGSQTITFNAPVSANVGTPSALNATSSSGLAVSYTASPAGVCTVSGQTLTPVATGTCTVTANQAGDNNYLVATSVTRSITVFAGGGARAVRVRSADSLSMVGRLSGNQLVFTSESDPGTGYRLVANVDLDNNGTPDLVYQNTTQGEFGDVRVWKDYQSSLDRYLRSVKLLWRVEATGDLDGDGYGDLVWRFTGQTPNIDDTGVSYVWFSNGTDITQVRKRGGAPLSWRLLGAIDINRDRAADMVYLAPDNSLRVLMATANRTCANYAVGFLPTGYTAMKLGDFTGSRLGEIFIRDLATGQNRIIQLDGRSLTLPAPTANPDDANASCTATSELVSATLRTYFSTDAGYQLYAAVDLNGDGITDLVWLKPNGQFQIWLMATNAGIPTILDNAGTPPAGFTVVAQ